MKYLFETSERPCMLAISVKTYKPQRIRVKAYPVNKDKKPFPFTLYTNRYATIVGQDKFLIKLPKTTQFTAVEIYNDALGNMPKGQDRTFTVVDIEKKWLPTQLFMFEFTNPIMASFIDFAENFANKCGYMSPGIYYSPDARFRIDYKAGALPLPGGKTSSTPARIGSETAIVEVSKDKFKNYTVAGRFVILCHEFSHFYKNINMKDEEEADYYSVNVALGKGYPEVEMLITYGQIFDSADNAGNRKRYDRIKKYINDFAFTAKKKKQELASK